MGACPLLLLSIFVAIGLLACTADGASEERELVSVTVTGTASGLWQDMRVELYGDDWSGRQVEIREDGAFSLDLRAYRGATIVLNIFHRHAGFTCTLDRTTFVATGEPVRDVALRCTGPVTDIALTGVTGWAFDPTRTSFLATASPDQVSVDVSVVAAVPVDVGIDHTEPPDGSLGPVRRDLALGSNVITVDVHASGAYRRFEIDVVRDDPTFNAVPPIHAPAPVALASFGTTVAAAGDWLAVGNVASGDVELYRQDSGQFVHAGTLATPVDGGGAWLEGALAMDGRTLAIGIVRSGEPGAVHVYREHEGAWRSEAALRASGTDAAYFGAEVAIAGDLLVVGGLPDVLVYRRTGTTWSEEARLAIRGGFGSVRLAVGEDLVAIGEPNASAASDEGPLREAGAVHLFARAGGTWSLSDTVIPLIPAAGAGFGSAVAVRGGFVAIGAIGGLGTGAAYLCRLEGAHCGLLAQIPTPFLEGRSSFGAAIGLTAELVFVGAPEDSTGAPDSGAVHTFALGNGIAQRHHLIKVRRPAAGAHLGASLAIAGSRLVVGAPWDATGDASRTGAIHTFPLPPLQLALASRRF